MSPHRAVIEAGPADIRLLCCGSNDLTTAGSEMAKCALEMIDDAVALVEERPVAVESLWRTVLQSLTGETHESIAIVHPSWWVAARVETVCTAAASLTDDVVARRRSWLLAGARSMLPPATVIVEIADRFVVITGAAVVAERRDGESHRVAAAVTRVVAEVSTETSRTTLIDAPATIAGAAALGAMIADELRASDPESTVAIVDDAQLHSLAAAAFPPGDESDALRTKPFAGMAFRRRIAVAAIAAAGLVVAVLGVGVLRQKSVPVDDAMPTTFLVEGRMALTIPAQWSARRVVGGPGSARIQVTSPTDPESVLHITQSPVVDETLNGTAEVLRRAIDAEPSGVFVDFNPSGRSAGRPAVTYRELRAGHDIRWSVLVDVPVRISIGCQSRPGGEDAVREVCELAVRSARALR